MKCTHKYVPTFHPFCEKYPSRKGSKVLIKRGKSSGNFKCPLIPLKENLIPITEIY